MGRADNAVEMPTASPTEPHRETGHGGATRLIHIPALDGLRGLAVAGVVAFHAGYLQGGFLGVDLFFTLSGFLITSLILSEIGATGCFGLRHFWVRRVRRLLPAVLAVVFVVLLYGRWIANPFQRQALPGDIYGTLFYVANWRQLAEGTDYWTQFVGPSPLQHTWSLAIEEQFYVVFPLLVAVVLALVKRAHATRGVQRSPADVRRAVSNRIVVVAMLLGAFSVYQMLRTPPADTSTISALYFGTDTRMASILVGVVTACLLDRGTSAKGEAAPFWLGTAASLAAGVAMAFIAIAWTRSSGTEPFIYRGGLLACATATAIVIVIVRRFPDGAIGTALAVPPLRWLGLVSYGVYLWHWPVFVVLNEERIGFNGLALLVTRLGATFAFVLPCYYLLEQPIRKGQWPTGRAAFVLGPLAVVGMVVLTVTMIDTTPPDVRPFLKPITVPGALGDSIGPERRPRVLLLGDSVPNSIALSLVPNAAEVQVDVRSLALPACGVAAIETRIILADGTDRVDGTGCAAVIQSWADEADTLRPDAALLVLGGPTHVERELNGVTYRLCDDPAREQFRHELSDAVSRIHPVVPTIAVATAPPRGAGPRVGEAASQVDCVNEDIRRVAAELPWLHVIDLAEFVCPQRVCRGMIEGFTIRPDGLHYWGESGALVGAWLLEKTLEAAADDRTNASAAAEATHP